MSNNRKAPQASAIKKAEGAPSGSVFSAARRNGRWLRLYFSGEEVPILDKIEFRFSAKCAPESRQRIGSQNAFQWRDVAKAVSLMFLEYAIWFRSGGTQQFFFGGAHRKALAKALGNAIYGSTANLLLIFNDPSRLKDNYAKNIFHGDNRSGWAGDKRERRITINEELLPADCIEIFWSIEGDSPLADPTVLARLARNFRKFLKIPEPPPKQAREARGESVPATRKPATIKPAGKVPPPKSKRKLPTTATELFDLRPKPPPKKPAAHPDKSKEQPKAEQAPPEPTAKTGPPKDSPGATKADVKAGGFEFEFKPPPPEPETKLPPRTPSPPPPPKIDPRLFQIHNPLGLEWNDSDPLINFGYEDSDADVWRIKDASEGLLIFGAVGSGKTSGSGSAMATAMLLAGYGGLVLTAKTDEARRWLRLCERAGRAADCIHVTPDSGHTLNVLQYELQRPGKRMSVTDDLVALLRCIVAVMSRSKRNDTGDDFWTKAPDKLMKNLFEIFSLAREPLSINSLTRFINRAPKQPNQPWRGLPYFAEIVNRAEENAMKGSDTDRRMFEQTLEYWTRTFPEIPEITRGGIVTSFDSMAETMNGRGIHEMLCVGTNLTPEMIMSGKIVILDFPVKEGVQGGLMIQATWKLLFQQAVERRADKGLPTARPVFLWEDEGHEFFSQHDVRFQPTARDVRASHVIMSQNLHNFLNLGHGQHAVGAVFAAMNTYIFHTNGDYETNEWASRRIGDLTTKKVTTDGLLRAVTSEEISIFPIRPENVKSIGHFSMSEETKRAVPPEDFAKLQKGGGGTCEAVVLWLSHQFEINDGKNYCVTTFAQEPR